MPVVCQVYSKDLTSPTRHCTGHDMSKLGTISDMRTLCPIMISYHMLLFNSFDIIHQYQKHPMQLHSVVSHYTCQTGLQFVSTVFICLSFNVLIMIIYTETLFQPIPIIPLGSDTKCCSNLIGWALLMSGQRYLYRLPRACKHKKAHGHMAVP